MHFVGDFELGAKLSTFGGVIINNIFESTLAKSALEVCVAAHVQRYMGKDAGCAGAGAARRQGAS